MDGEGFNAEIKRRWLGSILWMGQLSYISAALRTYVSHLQRGGRCVLTHASYINDTIDDTSMIQRLGHRLWLMGELGSTGCTFIISARSAPCVAAGKID
jgi:hypothetical protein